MGFPRCIVNLNDEKNVYISGSTINGEAVVELNNPDLLECLTIRLIGTLYMGWCRPKATIPYIKNYSARDRLLYDEINLIKDGNNPKMLISDVHKYRFSFNLPESTLSSFQGSFGKVEYFLEGRGRCLQTKKKFKSDRKPIHVTRKNCTPSSSIITPRNSEVKFYWTPNIEVYFEMESNIFIGETTKIKLKLLTGASNNSFIIQLLFIQEIEYRMKEGFAKELKILLKCPQRRINADELIIEIQIPEYLPTSYYSEIEEDAIFIQYYFEVIVSRNFLQKWSKKYEVDLLCRPN